MEGHALVNFEVAGSSSFQDNKKRHLVTAMTAEMADDDDSIER